MNIIFFKNSSIDGLNQTTDGFLNSILNDEDLQLMDMAVNEGNPLFFLFCFIVVLTFSLICNYVRNCINLIFGVIILYLRNSCRKCKALLAIRCNISTKLYVRVFTSDLICIRVLQSLIYSYYLYLYMYCLFLLM